jgi:hypothetical protein
LPAAPEVPHPVGAATSTLMPLSGLSLVVMLLSNTVAMLTSVII